MSSILALLLLASLACRPAPPATPLTIAAASDLAPLGDGFNALAQKQLGQPVTFVFGASGTLRRQLEQGAPYDAFLSANEQYVQDLASAGVLDTQTVRVYAVGTLGFWKKGLADGTKPDLPAMLRSAELRRMAIPNPQFAPYGVAARDYLQRAGVWETVEPKLIYGENVRQTAQYAASGNVDAVLSSWTLVKPLGGVQLVDGYPQIRQAAGVRSASPRRDLALRFLELLGSAEGRALLVEHGFRLP